MKQHKWHKEIKAWADGIDVEVRFADRKTYDDDWLVAKFDDLKAFDWNETQWEFRIKPEPEERYETIVEMPPKHKEEYLYVYYNYAIADYKVTIDPYFNFKRGIHQYIGKIKLEVEDE